LRFKACSFLEQRSIILDIVQGFEIMTLWRPPGTTKTPEEIEVLDTRIRLMICVGRFIAVAER
jgi:hypothetical protein